MTDSQIKTACQAVLGELFQPQQGYQAAGPLYGLKVASDALGRMAASDALGRMAAKLERAANEPIVHAPTKHTAEMSAGDPSAKATQSHWHLRCGHPLVFMVGESGDLCVHIDALTVALVQSEWVPPAAELRDILAIYAAYRLENEWHMWPTGDLEPNAAGILTHVRDGLTAMLRILRVSRSGRASDDDVAALSVAYADSIAKRAAAGAHYGPYPPSVAEQIYSNSVDLKEK